MAAKSLKYRLRTNDNCMMLCQNVLCLFPSPVSYICLRIRHLKSKTSIWHSCDGDMQFFFFFLACSSIFEHPEVYALIPKHSNRNLLIWPWSSQPSLNHLQLIQSRKSWLFSVVVSNTEAGCVAFGSVCWCFFSCWTLYKKKTKNKKKTKLTISYFNLEV